MRTRVMTIGTALVLAALQDRAPEPDGRRFVRTSSGGGQNDADVAFVQAMIPHHEHALVTAATVLAEGEDPAVRLLAEAVITLPSSEIGRMSAHLAGR